MSLDDLCIAVSGELTRRLLAHVDELEKAWPNLNPE
jgi:hypothetical protein